LELLELQKLYFYNVWGLWDSKSLFFGDAQKAIKLFKINGLGVFLEPPLARLWARTHFLDPPLVAQHGPSESIKSVVKLNEF